MHIDPLFNSSLFCYGNLLLVIICFGLVSRRRVKRAGRTTPQPQMRGQERSASPPQPPTGSGPQSYAPIRTLLTDAEQSFFATLRSATPPELVICPQVRLANLVRPTARNARQNKYDFYRIQAKCVDFVLCDAGTTTPCLVIELDDASHQRADRQKRDAFVDMVLAQVGLPILHIPWQRSYDPQHLADAIRCNVYGGALVAVVPLPAPPALVNGWLTPINVGAAPARERAPRAAAMHETTYVCGQCQHELRRDAKGS